MFFERLLFPSRCPFCSALIEPNQPTCERCFEYTQVAPHNQRLMNDCFCVSAFLHDGVWRKSVLDYKYHRNRQYYSQLAMILQNIISLRYSQKHFDLYTSVPMYKDTLKDRGFDHVKLLAKETARLNKAKYKPSLTQIKPNQSQHLLRGEERAENVKDIYRCNNIKAVKDKDILLFDDIITTGFTLNECSNVLLNVGARSVCCVTVNW